jgi:hypothetical protein
MLLFASHLQGAAVWQGLMGPGGLKVYGHNSVRRVEDNRGLRAQRALVDVVPTTVDSLPFVALVRPDPTGRRRGEPTLNERGKH